MYGGNKNGRREKRIKEDIENFDEEWNNLNPYLEVMDVPEAAKEGLIKMAPDTIEEVFCFVCPLFY